MKLTALLPKLSLIIVTLVLSACANMGAQKTLEIPLSQEQLGLVVGQTTTVLPQWWRVLKQPLLDQLMQTALAQAPDLKLAQARERLAQAQAQMTAGEGGLQLGAQVSGNGFYLNPKPESPNNPSNSLLANVSAMLQAQYVFDFWGKQSHLIEASLGQSQAAQLQVQQARLILSQAIVAQYTLWQLWQQQLEVVNVRLALNRSLGHDLQARIHAGILSLSSVYSQAENVLQLERQQQQLQSQIARARHSLAVLAGLNPNYLDGQKAGEFSQHPALVLSQVKTDILAQRPDISAQISLIQARFHQVQSAEAEFYPNIELSSLVGLSHVSAFDLLSGHSRFFGLMPALHLPIFTSGTLQAKLAARHAQYDEQVALYNKTVLNAMLQAADAISDYQSTTQALALQQKAWQIAQSKVSAQKRRQAVGLESGLNSKPMQDLAYLAQSQYFQLLAQHQLAWNYLQVALGGGFTQNTKSQ